MAIRFLCIDPDTNGGNRPAAFVDDETGDILIQGRVETNPKRLAAMAEHSRLERGGAHLHPGRLLDELVPENVAVNRRAPSHQ